jgi:capsular exopolysaccharide synthesis family protein
MDFFGYIKVGLRWWWLILLCVSLSAAASYFYTQRQPKIYAAKATLSVGQSIVQTLNPNEEVLGLSQTLAQVYGELARRKVITQAVIERLGLDMDADQLSLMIQTNVIPRAQLLEIIVLDTHPQRAQILANAVAEELILQTPGSAQEQQKREEFIHSQLAELEAKINDTDQKIAEQQKILESLTSAVEISEAQTKLAQLEKLKTDYQNTYTQFLQNRSDVSPNRLTIFEQSTEPTSPVGPNVKMNVAMAAAAGLVLAVGAILLIEFFNDMLIWRREDAQSLLGLPILGIVGKTTNNKKLIIAQEALWSPEADALRALRDGIFLAVGEEQPLSTLLVTSSMPGEGKSFVTANLAGAIASPGASAGAVIATPGHSVIIVDADLRKPTLHEIFDMPNLLGLADVLALPDAAIEGMLKKAIRPTNIDGLQIIPAGRTPLDPGSLLNSPRFTRVLQILSTQTNLVIIDSAPILEVTETKAIANMVDGVLLVVSDGRSRGKIVQKAVDYFKDKPNNNLLGLVFNRVKLARYYSYYSNYVTRERSWQPSRTAHMPAWLQRLWPFGGPQREDVDTLSLAEAADQLGVSRSIARRWCEEGRLPAVKQGRRWQIRLEDLNRFITTYQRGDAVKDRHWSEMFVADERYDPANGSQVSEQDVPERFSS